MNNAMRTMAAEAATVERYRGTVADSRFRRLWNANAPGYLFLLPWLLGFFGLTFGPALMSLYLSFTDFDMLRSPGWVGAANYVRIATADPKFASAMSVTLTYVMLAVPFKLAFALMVALALNRGIKGLPIYRAIFYLPSLLGASVAIAVLWRQLFAGDGLVNAGTCTIWHSGAELDFASELFALDAGCAQRLAVRLADDHLPRRSASDPAGHVRSRQSRRRLASSGSSTRSRCRF